MSGRRRDWVRTANEYSSRNRSDRYAGGRAGGIVLNRWAVTTDLKVRAIAEFNENTSRHVPEETQIGWLEIGGVRCC